MSPNPHLCIILSLPDNCASSFWRWAVKPPVGERLVGRRSSQPYRLKNSVDFGTRCCSPDSSIVELPLRTASIGIAYFKESNCHPQL